MAEALRRAGGGDGRRGPAGGGAARRGDHRPGAARRHRAAMPQLVPDEHDEHGRPDEREPERCRHPAVLREQAADRGPDDEPAEHPDEVDAADPPLQRGGYGPLPHGHRRGAPHERVQAEHEEDDERDRRGPREREAEVREGLDDEADPHEVREADPPRDPAVRQRPEEPAERADGRDETEPDGAEPELPVRVQHEHRPGGTPRDVEDEDRQHERADGRVVHDPADALGDVGDDVRPVRGLRPVRWQLDARHHDGAEHDERRLGRERQRLPGGEQDGADRRSDELVDGDEPGLDAGVRDGEVVAVHEHRHERARRVVGERLGGAEQEHRDQDERDRRDVGEDGGRQQHEHHGAHEVDRDDEPPPVEPVGERAGPQAEQQRRQPLQQRGERDEERVLRAGRHEQRSGGDDDAVAEVRRPRRREQPPEPAAEPGRHHDVDDPAHKGERLRVGTVGVTCVVARAGQGLTTRTRRSRWAPGRAARRGSRAA